MDAAVGMDMEQTAHQQDKKSIPIGGWRKERPFTQIGNTIQIGIDEEVHCYRTGKPAKLVAVDIYKKGDKGIGLQSDEDILVVQITNDDAETMQRCECVVELLE